MTELVSRFNAEGQYQPATIELADKTLFVDERTGTAVMVVPGFVPLPVGTVVELAEPNEEAKVVGLRLLAGGDRHPAMLRVALDVPKEFWYAIDRKWEELHPGEAAVVYGPGGPPLEVLSSDDPEEPEA